jgi:hypothetical protein
LLVLLVTAFFSYRGYARAVEEAEQGYAQWAVQNNEFAAELAAEKVTGEIGRYFRDRSRRSRAGRAVAATRRGTLRAVAGHVDRSRTPRKKTCAPPATSSAATRSGFGSTTT